MINKYNPDQLDISRVLDISPIKRGDILVWLDFNPSLLIVDEVNYEHKVIKYFTIRTGGDAISEIKLRPTNGFYSDFDEFNGETRHSNSFILVGHIEEELLIKLLEK